MSLRVHCDNCEKYMYETVPGIKWVPWAREQIGEWLFCSEACLQAWARKTLLHAGEASPALLGSEP